jgi:hypothetical protein
MHCSWVWVPHRGERSQEPSADRPLAFTASTRSAFGDGKYPCGGRGFSEPLGGLAPALAFATRNVAVERLVLPAVGPLVVHRELRSASGGGADAPLLEPLARSRKGSDRYAPKPLVRHYAHIPPRARWASLSEEPFVVPFERRGQAVFFPKERATLRPGARSGTSSRWSSPAPGDGTPAIPRTRPSPGWVRTC